jgi:hypothetical protein
MKSSIPADIPTVLKQVRVLGSFVGWDGKTVLTVDEIKTYCVPGNAVQAKGRPAIWLRSSKARKPMIIFPELVLLAMRFIAEPAYRGKRAALHPSNFWPFVEEGRSPAKKLPGLSTHSGVYLALARRLLGLPDDYQDPTTVQVYAECDAQWKARHPDIRTLDGLFSEVLLAYEEILSWQDPGTQGQDWVDLAYRALRSRHSTVRWLDDEPECRADLAILLQKIRSHPDHADIRKIDLAIFGMLFLNALAWGGKVRSSAVTTVVKRIADAAEAGVLAPFLQGIVEARESSSLAMEQILKRLVGSCRKR